MALKGQTALGELLEKQMNATALVARGLEEQLEVQRTINAVLDRLVREERWQRGETADTGKVTLAGVTVPMD